MTNKKILTLISLLLVSFLLVGCNGGVTPPNNAPVITSVPPSLTATVGTAYTYTVTATDADDDALTYSVSPSDLAIADNVITWTPTAAGTKDVVVSVSDATVTTTQSFTITVSEPVPEPVIELTGITVLPETMTLFAGESKTITSVTATYEIRGTEVPIALGDCTYASGDETVATAKAGVITAVAEGTATITVSYEGKTDTVAVTVSAAEIAKLTGIEVVPEAMALFEGGDPETIESVTATYSDGSTTVLALGDCTYASSAVGFATVSDAGVVTAVAKGAATITVSYTEEEITKTVYIEETDTIAVTVSAVELDHIVVLPAKMTLSVGENETIESITAFYNNSDEVEIELDAADSTYKSDDEDVATVVAGVVTAQAPGTATITVRYLEDWTYFTDTVEVTVPTPKVHNITQDIYYTTIEAALVAASNYDTIEVATGTYEQDATLEITQEGLTLKSIDGYATTKISDGIQISAPYVTVEGFTVGGWNAIQIGEENSDEGVNSAVVTGNKLADGLIFCFGGGDKSIISDNIIDGGGINLESYPGTLTDVTITGNDISNGNINMNGGDAVYTNILITGNTITESGTGYAGIDIRGTVSDFVVTHNDITDNPGGGIKIFLDCTWVADNDIVIHSNNIVGNTGFGLKNESTSAGALAINATNNWWGATSGPFNVDTNISGSGNAVIEETTGDVVFEPYSTSQN